MSAIDWLSQNPPDPQTGFVLLEPPISETGSGPLISVSPLEALEHPIGLVPASVTGLPVGLWQASDADTLAQLISDVPVIDHPAMQTLLYTLLLAETLQPQGDKSGDAFLMARVDRLRQLGAVDPAQALVLQAGPEKSATHFMRWFDATLLTGDEDRSCAMLATAPHLHPDYAARIFCSVRQGDWSAGAVMLDGARALDLMPQAQLFLLDRFLNPDIFDGAPPLPTPVNPDPLTFRLFESIGEPLRTASLPRAFAVADLRDLAGWKAQIEGAERLARTGALSPNRLLGIYTARLPAASGGVWDRVEALQRFETALDTRSANAVAKTLPAVWEAMQQARLEVPFADLFGDRLAAQLLLDAKAQETSFFIRLLSSGYEAAADAAPDTEMGRFLAALAHGTPQDAEPPNDMAAAIADGFADPAKPADNLQAMIDTGRLGQAILMTMTQFARGAQGNLSELSAALSTFRALGLEDTARRASLQLLLLQRG